MFSTPEVLPEPINVAGSLSVSPWLSHDGLRLYFSSDRPGGYGAWDLWFSEREATNANWNAPVNMGPAINSAKAELQPSLSADELTLYFGDGNPFSPPPRSGRSYDIWMTSRATRESPWREPTALGPPINSDYIDGYPHLTVDGLSFYFTSTRPGGVGLYRTARAAANEPWAPATFMGSLLNQGSYTGFPVLSHNGLHLIFYSDRSGTVGGYDLWIASRMTVTGPWTNAPVNLGRQINTGFFEVSEAVSADFPAIGSYMLFARNNASSWNLRFKLYRAEVIPALSVEAARNPAGPWVAASSTFIKDAQDTIVSELAFTPLLDSRFFRVAMAGGSGVVRFESMEKAGERLRFRFRWSR
jgi:hypothetical protein